ncbi:MAG: hypothetical protein Q4P36_02140 [Bowdeniella nasicola]|nr:hypothetical protein [Bowdeniella nasicola]
MARAVGAAHFRGQDSIVCGVAGALLQGLAAPPDGAIVMIGGRGSNRRYSFHYPVSNAPAHYVVRRRRLPPDVPVAEIAGVRVLEASYLAIDYIRSSHPREALILLDSYLRQQTQPDRFSRTFLRRSDTSVKEKLFEVLQHPPFQHYQRRLENLITLSSPWADSVPESAARWALLALGFSEPECQYRLLYRGRETPPDCMTPAFIDLFLRDPQLCIEVDGALKYQDDPRALINEKYREDAIRRRYPNLSFVRLLANEAMDIHAVADIISPYIPVDMARRLRPSRALLPRHLSRIPRITPRAP